MNIGATHGSAFSALMRGNRFGAVLALSFMTMLITTAHAGAPPDFESDVKPIFKEHCISCHGQVKQKGGLRLDAGILIAKGGEHGPAVAPGRTANSLLLQRAQSNKDDERMPKEGKPLPKEKIDTLRRWIEAGAQFPKDEVIPRSPADHWAFQRVIATPVPTVSNRAWVRNPIDAFVLAKLAQQGWKPAPPAEPTALLRRVSLDLTGLPPTPDEQQKFAQHPTAQAIDAVIDDLLAHPEYGERWARHWLDVVRYADSNGYERDAEKPFVWRYRDYIIDSLNADKPFDRFMTEQIAGDELPDCSAETMIATSYLRLGHWDDEPADPATDRYDQLDDIVSTTGQTFLGLTIGCARCHDHKFEPLATRDYYSLVAVFNPLRRPNGGRSDGALPVGTRAQLEALAARDAEIGRLMPDRKAPPTPETSKRIAALRAVTPDLPQAYVLNESPGRQPQTHVLLRGSPSRLGDAVEPAVPAILVKQQPAFPPPGERTTRRRLGLAQWLASDDNPLTARVIVNRVWQQHFGQGLVRTANDFGLMGAPPTHPELLDWLAYWFAHDAQWSMKKLHRLILTSNTWRMSKASNGEYATLDPENRLLWHMPYRRLEVEAIRDSMLAASGQLNPKRFGPAMRPRIPDAALAGNSDPKSIWNPSDEREASRRSIYIFVKRGLVVPMLEVLDLADTNASCPQRQVTTVAPQALSLFNGEFVNRQAHHLAERLAYDAGDDSAKQMRLAFRLALCREPTAVELGKLIEYRDGESRQLLMDAVQDRHPLKEAEAQRFALEQACRVILNLNEFAYPE